mmetsp:Transcript_22158/g.55868  ORF Transcript_22158/g.55868 Transcript_22158/m.55868 type:complete len:220 (+) Transcript_22158:509-1168(+)
MRLTVAVPYRSTSAMRSGMLSGCALSPSIRTASLLPPGPLCGSGAFSGGSWEKHWSSIAPLPAEMQSGRDAGTQCLRGCFRSTCPPPPAFLNKQRVQSAAPDQRRRPWSTALTPTAATAAILRLAGGGLTGRHGAIRMSSSILQTRRHSIYCTRRRSCPMLLVVPILRRIEPACTCVCGTALFQGIGLHLAIVAMFSGFGLALQPTAMASRAVVLLTTL